MHTLAQIKQLNYENGCEGISFLMRVLYAICAYMYVLDTYIKEDLRCIFLFFIKLEKYKYNTN